MGDKMMTKYALVFAALVVCANAGATLLEEETFDDAIAGKSAFVKFFAPWCGHCKKLKPAWDQLADEYAGNPNVVIVDVDCTAGGKSLCSKHGVRGYPTLKYFTGSTDAMGDKYEGGRSLDDLKAFVDENFGPSCGPDNIDLCSDEQKAAIEKYQAMDSAEVEKLLKEKTDALESAEETFKAEVKKLQETYEKLMADKDATIAEITPELRVIRSVVAASEAKSEGKDEL